MENSAGLNQLDYKLELIKNKGIHEQSAIASFEVKKRLQEFVLQKKKREAATATSSGSSTGSSTASSSQDYSNVPNINAIIGQELNPLRKTASEPNIKVRSALKAKVFERRCSPLLKRKLTKRSRTGITLPVSGLVYASNPTLPICGGNGSGVYHSGQQQGDPCQGHGQVGQHGILSLHHQLMQQQHQVVDLSPPSSPTSISIQMRLLEQGNSSPTPTHVQYNSYGHVIHPQLRPHLDHSAQRTVHHPLLHLHQLQSSLPCPSDPPFTGQDSSSSPSMMVTMSQSENSSQERNQESVSSHRVHQQERSQESVSSHRVRQQERNQELVSSHRVRQQPSSTLSQAPRCKPLVRTLSSPLPLGQAMSAGSATAAGHVTSGYSSPSGDGAVNLSTNNNSITNLASTPGQLNQRKYLLQHIRQTVLTRASSKQQLQRQSFEEETEAAIEQEMKDVDVSEINSPTSSPLIASSPLVASSPAGTTPAHHLTPKAKFKRQQFEQDTVNLSMFPQTSYLNKQSSLESERENEHRHLQTALWASGHLGHLSKPISGLVYASNPSLPITGHGHHHPVPGHHKFLHHHQMPDAVPSPPSSPTSVSMQMRLLEQGHSSPPSGPLHGHHPGNLSHHVGHIHHPQPLPQRPHHPLLHLHQFQSSLPTYTHEDSSHLPSSAMVTNHSELDQGLSRNQETLSLLSSRDPSQPQDVSILTPGLGGGRCVKPLIRTLSSPLPLGRGILSSSTTCSNSSRLQYPCGTTITSTCLPFEEGGALNLSMNNNHNNNNDTPVSKVLSESISSSLSQPDRKYLLQHIRQTVITRVSSKNQKQQEMSDESAKGGSGDTLCGKEEGEERMEGEERKEGEERMEEEEESKDVSSSAPVDGSNSSPSTSSPLFSSCSTQSVMPGTHLTPKAKFLRQFLQDNISNTTSSVAASASQSYSPPSSSFVSLDQKAGQDHRT